MKTARQIIAAAIASGLLIFCLPFQPLAKMFVETHIASGRIAVIQNNIITLDDGSSYIPLKQDPSLQVIEGQTVSIRYIIDSRGEKKYSKVVVGQDSLEMISAPEDTEKMKK